MTQEMVILKALKDGEKLTAVDALSRYGVGRMAARCYDLRMRGYKIHVRMLRVKTRFGYARVAEYSL